MGRSFGRGIFLYASNGKRLKEFNTYLNFPSNTINQIFEDSKGCIWLQQEKVLSKSRTVHLGNIRSTSAMRDWPIPLSGPLRKMKTRISGSAPIRESAVLFEMKKISTITISGTIFQWQVSPEEASARAKMELCILAPRTALLLHSQLYSGKATGSKSHYRKDNRF